MKKIRKWIIMSADKQYVSASDTGQYTVNIDDAFVYYRRSDAVAEKTEFGEQVIEVATKNTIIGKVKK